MGKKVNATVCFLVLCFSCPCQIFVMIHLIHLSLIKCSHVAGFWTLVTHHFYPLEDLSIGTPWGRWSWWGLHGILIRLFISHVENWRIFSRNVCPRECYIRCTTEKMIDSTKLVWKYLLKALRFLTH